MKETIVGALVIGAIYWAINWGIALGVNPQVKVVSWWSWAKTGGWQVVAIWLASVAIVLVFLWFVNRIGRWVFGLFA